MRSFCFECDWTASTDTVTDLSRAMIEHHLETGHDVNSIEVTTSAAEMDE